MPHSDPDFEAKQSIILILCCMLVIAGLALGRYVTVVWTILSLALSLMLYVRAFHLHWHGRK